METLPVTLSKPWPLITTHFMWILGLLAYLLNRRKQKIQIWQIGLTASSSLRRTNYRKYLELEPCIAPVAVAGLYVPPPPPKILVGAGWMGKTLRGLRDCYDFKWIQDIALTGRNTTGPPWSVGRPSLTRPAAGSIPTPRSHAPGDRLARTPAALQTTTDDSQQNNTGQLGKFGANLSTL